MDKDKQLESLRKRNADLTAQVYDLQEKLKEAEANTPTRAQQAQMDKLKSLEDEWHSALADLKEKSAQCDKMMESLKESKQVVKTMGFKLPWYKKIRLRYEQKKDKKERQKEIEARKKTAEENK